MNSNADRAKIALYLKVAAAIVAAVPVIRAVTGYYQSDVVWMLPMLAIAGALFFVAGKMG